MVKSWLRVITRMYFPSVRASIGECTLWIGNHRTRLVNQVSCGLMLLYKVKSDWFSLRCNLDLAWLLPIAPFVFTTVSNAFSTHKCVSHRSYTTRVRECTTVLMCCTSDALEDVCSGPYPTLYVHSKFIKKTFLNQTTSPETKNT